MGMFAWDTMMQQTAEKWLPSVCNYNVLISPDSTQNLSHANGFFAPGKTEEDYAEIFFDQSYGIAKRFFQFADETTVDVAGCFKVSQRANKNLMATVYMTRNIYFKNFHKLG